VPFFESFQVFTAE